ncbi:MAG TPA: ferrochelatase, partial [Porticoccaceae bacterium]|nr:ferrochelatase [Porticoccaceae bacterium]
MEPSAAAVRRFLREFLSDQRVVEAPKWLWRALLNLVILPVRSRRVAGSYKKIW